MSQRTVILRINRIFSHLDCRTERLEDWRTAGPDARGQTAGLADWRTGGLRIKKVMHRDARQPLMGCGGAKQQTPTAAGLGLDCLSANCRPAVSRRNSPPTTRLSGLEDSRSETGTKLMPTLFDSDEEEDHVSDDEEGDVAESDDDDPNAATGGEKRPDASPPDPPARRYPKRGRKG